MDFKGAKVVVMGLGKSGLGAVDLLVRKGALVLACDSQPLDRLQGAAETLARLGATRVTAILAEGAHE